MVNIGGTTQDSSKIHPRLVPIHQVFKSWIIGAKNREHSLNSKHWTKKGDGQAKKSKPYTITVGTSLQRSIRIEVTFVSMAYFKSIESFLRLPLDRCSQSLEEFYSNYSAKTRPRLQWDLFCLENHTFETFFFSFYDTFALYVSIICEMKKCLPFHERPVTSLEFTIFRLSALIQRKMYKLRKMYKWTFFAVYTFSRRTADEKCIKLLLFS